MIIIIITFTYFKQSGGRIKLCLCAYIHFYKTHKKYGEEVKEGLWRIYNMIDIYRLMIIIFQRILGRTARNKLIIKM